MSFFQESVQISKQEQSQSYSNSTMCHTLSAAENLAFRICLESGDQNYIFKFFEGYRQILQRHYQNQKLIFDAYDSFDGGKKKPIKDLVVQLIFLIENFKGDYSYYVSHYQKYDYPMNLDENQVIQLILHWYNIIHDIEISNPKAKQIEISKYYLNLMKVIQNKPSIDYTQDIYNFEADNPNRGKINPNALGQGYSKALKHQEEYIFNNAKTKKVDLYGKNSLKLDNMNYGKGNSNEPKHGGHHSSGGTKPRGTGNQGPRHQNCMDDNDDVL